MICVSGDGSFMMNVQELGTIKRKQLPLKMLLDNQRLGMVRWQQLFFDGRYSETNLSDNPDFLMLAAAFGIPGQRISRKDQVDAPRGAVQHRRPLSAAGLYRRTRKRLAAGPGAGNETMLEEIS